MGRFFFPLSQSKPDCSLTIKGVLLASRVSNRGKGAISCLGPRAVLIGCCYGAAAIQMFGLWAALLEHVFWGSHRNKGQ